LETDVVTQSFGPLAQSTNQKDASIAERPLPVRCGW